MSSLAAPSRSPSREESSFASSSSSSSSSSRLKVAARRSSRSRSRSRLRGRLSRARFEPTADEQNRGVTEAMIAQACAGGYASFITSVIPTLVMSIVLYASLAAVGHLAVLVALFPSFGTRVSAALPLMAPALKLVTPFLHSTSPFVFFAFVPILLASALLTLLYRRHLASNAAIIGHAVVTAIGSTLLFHFGLVRASSAATLWPLALYIAHVTMHSALSDLTLYCHHYIPLRRWQYTYIVVVAALLVAFPFVRSHLPALPAASALLPASSPFYHVVDTALSHRLSARFHTFLTLAWASVPALEAIKSLGLFLLYAFAPNLITLVVIMAFIVACSFGSLALWLYAGFDAAWPEMVLLVVVAWLMVKNLVKANEEPRWKGFGTPAPLASKKKAQ